MFSFKSSLGSSFNGSRVPNQGFMEESDVQEQLSRLHEELRKERQEKARALDEIQELRMTNKNRSKKIEEQWRRRALGPCRHVTAPGRRTGGSKRFGEEDAAVVGGPNKAA